MKRFKSPNPGNKRTGNICMSHDEFAELEPGQKFVTEGDNFVFTKTVESWMLDHAVDKGRYMLVPYTEKSWLVPRY